MLPHATDGVRPAQGHAGLRTAQQLVAGEHHDVRVADRLGDQRLVEDRFQGAAAQVVQQQQPVPARDLGELCDRRRLGEAGHPEVGGVHPQQRRRTRADRRLVVRRTGAVGGPHLHHAGARQPHHVRHPERAPDLDLLTARDDDLAAPAQRGQGQQHGGRVVVHNQGRLGAGQALPEVGDQRVAVASPAAGQVELEVRVPRRHLRRGRGGPPGQRRPAQVGVQHHTGAVDHPPQPGVRPPGQPIAVCDPARRPLVGQLVADGVDEQAPRVALLQPAIAGLVQERANSGQGLSVVYPAHWPSIALDAGWKKMPTTAPRMSKCTR